MRKYTLEDIHAGLASDDRACYTALVTLRLFHPSNTTGAYPGEKGEEKTC